MCVCVAVGARLSYAITLLLTMVAFQFVISSSVPVLPYLTCMDKYIIATFLFIAGVCVQSGLFAYFNSTLGQYDREVSYAAAVYWTIYHIVYVIYVVIVHQKNVRRLGQSYTADFGDASHTDFVIRSKDVRVSLKYKTN